MFRSKSYSRPYQKNRPISTVCYFCQQGIANIDYQDIILLKRFVSAQAKIANPKRTGTCRKHQRLLGQAVKRARYLALLPFTNR